MPASAWSSMPLWRVSSMRRDSERISFSIDSIARRGIASVMACANLGQFAAERGDRLLDPVGALQRFDLAGDLEQMTFERREIGPGRRRRRHCVGATGGALRGGIGRGAALSSSLWRAVISAIARSSEPGLSGGDGR